MKNYYEILEVDMKASKEIIEKAFKVLAKRYHPDTQEEAKKEWAEAKFKEINEAYEVLSNETSRNKYDTELEFDKNSGLEAVFAKNKYLENLVEELQNELDYLKKQNAYNQNSNEKQYNYSINSENRYTEEYQEVPKYTYYQNPYVKYNNIPQEENMYYVSNKNKLKSFVSFIITIFIIFTVGFILWKIPFTKNFFIDLYEKNLPIKTIVDFFSQIFSK